MDLKLAKSTVFLATTNAKMARAFYEGTLGLVLAEDGPFALVYALNGAELRLSKIPEHTPQPFTVLDWQVGDIGEAYTILSKKGVEFMRYDVMDQDARGVWITPDGGAQVLWFQDPDGNVLSVSERKS